MTACLAYVGVVYMVRALVGERRGLVKIGYTQKPEKRLREICQEPFVRGPIEVLWSRAGDRFLERDMHSHYAAERVRNEWFNLSLRQVYRYLHRPSLLPRVVVVPKLRCGGHVGPILKPLRQAVETSRACSTSPG